MGLDIYAGTLTRYYAGNWKTVAQQFAEESGLNLSIVRPNSGTPENNKLTVDEIQNDMQEWSNAIATALTPASVCEAWEENNDKNYYTDKPDWCAFGALLLYGACLKYDIQLPERVKKNWDFSKDLIVGRALNDTDFSWSLFSAAEWWLPFDDCFSFDYPTPNGHEITMGTTGALLVELQGINELSWNADEPTILEWAKNEGYPADAEMADGAYNVIGVNDEYDVQSLAKFAFSILYQAAVFSDENRVPVIMDY